MTLPRYGDLDLGAARWLGRRVELAGCLMLRRGDEEIDAVERGVVDRGRWVELRAASGPSSESCGGRWKIGAKRAVWRGDAAMVMRCRS